MKLLPLCLAAGCLALILPWAGSHQNAGPAQVHIVSFGLESANMSFAADDIVRENPPIYSDNRPYATVTHLKGHVEIRACCMQPTNSTPAHPDPPRSNMILHADEADYHEATGEIEAHGTVRITFQSQR